MTENSIFRVEEKQNLHMSGRKTAFKLFRKRGSEFVFEGAYTAPGWDQSDEKCIAAAMEKQEQQELDD